jgi:uncharacterized membrane protein YccC
VKTATLQAHYPPANETQSVRHAIMVAGFPLSAWAFAWRTWAAMMVALYAAFWLQLEGASTAAVTVGILALQTRGQAYEKAIYRVLATIIGVVASFVIVGLFPQTRELFLIGFAGWLGLCVNVGGLLDGNRAYGAVLSGYTVAVVAVLQIDTPQSTFMAGVNRGAAIVVGTAALALVSDLFAAPNVHTGLSDKLVAAQQRVRAFALDILRGEKAHPVRLANLLREITALHPDMAALFVESSDGRARGAAARSAAVALVAEVNAARALSSLPTATFPSVREPLGEALADAQSNESHALRLHLQRKMDVGSADCHATLFARHALDLLIENRRVRDAIEDLRAGRRPLRQVRAPIYRSHRAATRNALRSFLAVLISATLLSLPICGLIAYYNGVGDGEQNLLPATMLAVLRRSLLLRGYINTEFVDEHYDSFLREIGPRVRAGDIRYREDIVHGIENAPEAFIGMLRGRNFGKALVRLI